MVWSSIPIVHIVVDVWAGSGPYTAATAQHDPVNRQTPDTVCMAPNLV